MSTNAFTPEKGSFAASVLLGKCNHSSAFEVYDVFFLESDTNYLIARSPNTTWFPNFLIQNRTESDGGRYHCLLHYQGNRYRSEKYVITFKGNLISFDTFWTVVYPNLLVQNYHFVSDYPFYLPHWTLCQLHVFVNIIKVKSVGGKVFNSDL